MTKEIAFIISIAIIVLLLVIFIVSFIINRKMPKPEGCSDIEINDNNCGACNNLDCRLKRKIKIEELKKELDKEEE